MPDITTPQLFVGSEVFRSDAEDVHRSLAGIGLFCFFWGQREDTRKIP